MKTPDEIKKGLAVCINDTHGCDERCPYLGCESNGVECASSMHVDALAYITQLERENASLDKAVRDAAELMQSGADLMRKRFEELEHSLSEAEEERERLMNVDAARVANIQLLEDRLAQAERERDALMHDFAFGFECRTCKHETTDCNDFPCNDCVEASREAHCLMWEWRGVCEENSR